MRNVFFLIFATSVALRGQSKADPNLYPEVRALILEAELAANGLRMPENGSNPWTWAGSLYAQAGYVEDAERLFGPSAEPPYKLWKARVVYGDLAGAEASLDKIAKLESRAACFASLADLLWRMQRPDLARIRFEKARRLAAQIPELKARARVLAEVQRGLTYVGDDPPIVISPVPKPRQRQEQNTSPIPDFPMTTDGFRERPSAVREALMRSDAVYLKTLYDRMAAKDREGVFGMVEETKSARQKGLGFAAIGHILIQGAQAEAAEETIRRMPESDVDSRLAKAEALGATGGAWLLQGKSEPADRCFRDARRLVEEVKELPMAKVLVMLRLAKEQSAGGMVSTSADSLQRALEFTALLPVRPQPVKGQRQVAPVGLRYRDEGYRLVLLAAIGARDLGVATAVEEKWKGAGDSIAMAWWRVGQKERALAAARRIVDQQERVSALLEMARSLLDEGGAPNF